MLRSVAGGRKSTRRNRKRRGQQLSYRPVLENLEVREVPTTPSVLSINRSMPLGPYTNATSVSYAVTFNESVTGVAASDFLVTTSGGGAAGAPVAVSGSGSNYTISVNGIHGSGSLRLDLIDNDSIQSGGVPLGGAGVGNGSFEGQTYNILQTFPSVVSINRAVPSSGTTNASTVSFAVTFSEPVTGVNPTDFQVVNSGTAGTTLTQVAPSGPASVYTVTISGITGNGTLGLNLVDNGNIRDLAGNPLTQQNAPAAFQTQQTFATGPGARATALGDLTNDGKADLVVANRFTNTISVLLGNGDGTFQAQQTFTTSGNQMSVALGDVNGDGKPDLVIANAYGVGVLLGNGNGSFQAQQTFATGNMPDSVALSDLNGDGKPDLVVANQSDNTLSVLLGNGNGTFQGQLIFATGTYPKSVVAADLNGDRKPDLVVASYSSATVSVLVGNGNGTFQATETIGTGALATAAVVGDVNGDGIPDLAVANSSNGTVSVLLGNGNGTFQAQQTLAAGSFPTAVVLADVNGDGKPDLEVANPGFESVSVLVGNGNGTFQARQVFVGGDGALSMALGDVNGDGRPDLVEADNGSFTVSVLLNAGNGDFTGQVYTIDTIAPFVESINRTTPAGPGTNAGSVSITVTFSESVTGVNASDFELVLSGGVSASTPIVVSGGPSVYQVTVSGISSSGSLGLNLVDNGSIHDLAGNPLTEQNAAAAFQNQQTFATGPGARAMALGDVNGDGIYDLVVANRFTNTISLLLGNGDGTFQAQQTFTTAGSQMSVALGDVNGDGKPDLVIANAYGVGVLLGNGNATFQAQQTFATGNMPDSVALSDLNGDGKPDLVVANQSSNTLSVLLGNGNGTFQAQLTFATGTYPKSVVAADLTGDGIPDLVVASYSSATLSVLLGNGNGTFQASQTIGTGAFATSAVAGDVNGDGIPDLAVANSNSGTISVLLGNGNGTFQSQQTFMGGAFPTALILADVNGDGKPDLAVANPAFDTVSVLLGNGNGTFQALQVFAGGDGALSMALGDVTGDGRPDLVTANNGSFTVSVLLNAGNGNFTGQVYTIVSPSAPTHFVVTGTPTSLTAGSSAKFTVLAEDQFNEVSYAYSGTVHFSSGDRYATLPDNTTLTSGAGTFSATLTTAGTAVLTATDSGNSSLNGSSPAITVSSAGPNHFVIRAPAAAAAGTATVFTVTAQDQYFNAVPGYTGTVHFLSTDTAATLPADATLTSGIGTFSAMLATVGNQTLMAVDVATGVITGVSGNIAVSITTTHFVVVAPGVSVAGNPFPFVVVAEDAFNNVAVGYTGTVIFASSDNQAGLPAHATLTGGIGYFAAELKTAGNQTITATDLTTNSINGASGVIAVSAAAASHFAISLTTLPSYAGIPAAYPNTASAASTFASTGTSITFTVTALDLFGNVAPAYAGTVIFTSSDTAAGVNLPFNSTLTSGIGVFSATLQTPGSQVITATDTSNGSISGNTGAIVTRGLMLTSFAVTPSGFTVSFNKPFNPSVVNLYTTGTLPDDVLLLTTGAVVSLRGSLLFNATDTGFTFVKTATTGATGNFTPTLGLLAAGKYTITMRSFNGGSGFEDSLGGFLDGTDTAHPGTNYEITFSVAPPPVAVGIPDFARGPSNTDALFFSPAFANGSTFALGYTNPNTSTTATATVTFSTIAATLQANIQTALNGLAQIGFTTGTPNTVVVATNDTTTGANVLVTFQNTLATAASQLLTTTTPGITIGQATVNVPNSQPGNGIPIALSNGTNVTSGTFVLTYNPALLSITGAVSKLTAAGATFSIVSNNTSGTSGTLTLSLSSPTPISATTTALTLGSLVATVPLSATASYGAKQLLHFSSEQLNNGAITVTNVDGVQVVAYLGDVLDKGGPFTLNDAGAIATVSGEVTNTSAQTIPGFTAFPNLDPVIIGDVSLQGSVNSTDAGTMNQEVGGTARVTIPYAPIGLSVAPVGPDLVELSAGSSQLSARLERGVLTAIFGNHQVTPRHAADHVFAAGYLWVTASSEVESVDLTPPSTTSESNQPDQLFNGFLIGIGHTLKRGSLLSPVDPAEEKSPMELDGDI